MRSTSGDKKGFLIEAEVLEAEKGELRIIATAVEHAFVLSQIQDHKTDE